MADDLDDTPTGPLKTALTDLGVERGTQPATQAQLAEVAAAVRKLLDHREREIGRREADARTAVVWRGLGGLAASAALALGSYALTLASTAAQDHERLVAVTEIAESNREAIRAGEQTSHRLELALARLETLADEMREIVRTSRRPEDR